MKYASNYNRNVYLDILKYTRQDKDLKVEGFPLEADSRQMTIRVVFGYCGTDIGDYSLLVFQ